MARGSPGAFGGTADQQPGRSGSAFCVALLRRARRPPPAALACGTSTCSSCSRSRSRSGSSTAATSSRPSRSRTRRWPTCSGAWSGSLARRARSGRAPVWPVWLLAAGDRLPRRLPRRAQRRRDSNVIDVGYSGVIGADRIVHGEIAVRALAGRGDAEAVWAAPTRRARSASASRRTAAASRRTSAATPTARSAYEAYIPGYARLRLEREVGRPARGARDLDPLRPARPARAGARRPALRRRAARARRFRSRGPPTRSRSTCRARTRTTRSCPCS